MKAILILLLLAATAAAGEITITGPSETHVGESVQLRIDGLPKVAMDVPFSETVEWFERDDLTLRFSAPSGSAAAMDEELTMTVRPFRWRYRLEFTADAPGAYMLVTAWRHGDVEQLLIHRVEVAGPGPDPDPAPLENPFPAPSTEARQAVGPITQISMSRQNANRLSSLYEAAAAEVEVSLATKAAGVTPDLATTHDLNQLLTEETKQLDMQGRYSGLGAAVDAAATTLLGTTLRQVQDSDPPALRAIGWAIWEAGR